MEEEVETSRLKFGIRNDLLSKPFIVKLLIRQR